MPRASRIVMVLVSLLYVPSILGAEEEKVLTWADCVARAKVTNPDLASVLAQVTQARANRTIAGSPLLPQIAAEGRASKIESDTAEEDENHSYRLTGEQLLFDGFKTPFEMAKTGQGITASQYKYRVTSSNVRLRLRRAFIELLRVQELLGITEEIAGRRKQNRDLVTLRYEAGREHRGSLMLSEADFAQAEYEVGQAVRGIALSQRRLNKEMGLTHMEPVRAKEDVVTALPERVRPDFERLAETNPLLRQLIAQKEAARWGVKSAVADFFPQVFANTELGRIGTSWPPEDNEWSIGLSLSWPLFEGRRRVGEVSRTKGVLGQAEADERSGRDGVILTMQETWTLLQDARDFVIVQGKQLQAAEERAKISRAQYTAGLIIFDDWTIIEDALVKARKAYLDALAAAAVAEAGWVQAQGWTLEDEPR